MAKVVLSAEMQRFTGGAREVEVEAEDFPALLAELCRRFPDLGEDTVRKQSLGIDGMLIHTPMLETFGQDSQLVFVTRIAGG
ncbi:hypothetical protein E4634_03295 [Mangrovimicrobium sediminis]|uniref:MoaD/ThiS family protein n=1 Tax=Mangrovimicrobium sediminis TaxID=2562682 RepID=A0A4Z0M7L7_9GAMM|nr:hypothetical protein [Haliea sp. SAOS-164]TGD75484.1 hypothetical protein E4634_03295 [Haliea sp. SAOS-164]